jgi:hypothetical protein
MRCANARGRRFSLRFVVYGLQSPRHCRIWPAPGACDDTQREAVRECVLFDGAAQDAQGMPGRLKAERTPKIGGNSPHRRVGWHVFQGHHAGRERTRRGHAQHVIDSASLARHAYDGAHGLQDVHRRKLGHDRERIAAPLRLDLGMFIEAADGLPQVVHSHGRIEIDAVVDPIQQQRTGDRRAAGIPPQ